MKKHWRGVSLSVGAVVFFMFLGFFLYITLELIPSQEAVWYTGEGVLLALLALTAGGLAAVFTYPAYRDWLIESRKRAEIRISIEVASGNHWDDFIEVPEGRTYNVGPSGIFRARVSVYNDGDGTLRSGDLNILMPAPSKLNAVVNAQVRHYDIPGTALNGRINPPQVTAVKATEVRDEFTPFVTRMYHVEGEFSQDRTSLFAELSGDPPTYTNSKIFLQRSDGAEGLLP